MQASRYYPEGRKYREELPATIHALIHFIRTMEAEVSFLTPEEKRLWINKELRPLHNYLRPSKLKRPQIIEQLKPTFEEFMEQRNTRNQAA